MRVPPIGLLAILAAPLFACGGSYYDSNLGTAKEPAGPPKKLSPKEEASALRLSAAHKSKAGDGPGCLADLDRATRLDASEDTAKLRAECVMRTGDCQKGKEDLRRILEKEQSGDARAMVDNVVAMTAARACPADKLTAEEKLLAAALRIQDAAAGGDFVTCVKQADLLIKELPKVPERVEVETSPRGFALEGVSQAGWCAAKAGLCDDARRILVWYANETSGRTNVLMGNRKIAAPDAERSVADEIGERAPACK
jgi:hypothetical protein